MQGNHRSEFGKDNWLPRSLVLCFRVCGWVDVSWGNDACPSFELGSLRCWCDAKRHGLREGFGSRYCVTDDDGNVCFECERTADMINWLLREGNNNA